MKQKNKKKKMLVYADSAICSTGFGQVARNILKRIADEYDITQFAINHPDLRDNFGAPVSHDMPFEILEAKFLSPEDVKNGFKPSPYGKRKFAQYVLTHDFDIFFTIQDPIIMKDMIEFLYRDDVIKKRESFGFNKVKTVAYFPVDSDYFYKEWEDVVENFDVAVPYTFYAKDKCLAHNKSSKVHDPIYHGIDTEVFRPLSKKEKKVIRQYYKIPLNSFVVGNVARNQPRKDPPRLIMAFKEFKKKVKDAVLVMVCDPEEIAYNLNIVNKNFGLETGKDVFFLGPKMGDCWETNKINELYGLFDVALSASTGEGWGLCVDFKTKIFTEHGIKEIKDINITDRVLGSNGEYNQVLGIKSRKYTGDLYSITSWKHNIPLKCSDEHRFMVWNKGFVPAKDLKIGDELCFPITKIDTKKEFNILEYLKPRLNRYQSAYLQEEDNTFTIQSNFKRSIPIPKEIIVDEDVSFLIGLYLAEGCCTPRTGNIVFSFNKKEQNLIDEVIRIMKEKFGIKKFNYHSKKRSQKTDYQGLNIVFHSSILSNLFYFLFGKNAREKMIPSFLFKKCNIESLIKGMFLGDGCFKKDEICFSTTSQNLAYTYKQLCAMLDISVSLSTNRTEYKLRIGGLNRGKFWEIIKGEKKDYKYSPKQNRCRREGDFIIFPIKEVNKEQVINYDLMDIEVENTHDFVAEGFIIHNCTTESFATKVPFIAPNNTVAQELIGSNQERGYLCNSGNKENLWTVMPYVPLDPPRPLLDIEHAAELLYEVYQERPTKKIEAAYQFAQNNNWDIIAERWRQIFNNL